MQCIEQSWVGLLDPSLKYYSLDHIPIAIKTDFKTGYAILNFDVDPRYFLDVGSIDLNKFFKDYSAFRYGKIQWTIEKNLRLYTYTTDSSEFFNPRVLAMTLQDFERRKNQKLRILRSNYNELAFFSYNDNVMIKSRCEQITLILLFICIPLFTMFTICFLIIGIITRAYIGFLTILFLVLAIIIIIVFIKLYKDIVNKYDFYSAYLYNNNHSQNIEQNLVTITKLFENIQKNPSYYKVNKKKFLNGEQEQLLRARNFISDENSTKSLINKEKVSESKLVDKYEENKDNNAAFDVLLLPPLYISSLNSEFQKEEIGFNYL